MEGSRGGTATRGQVGWGATSRRGGGKGAGGLKAGRNEPGGGGSGREQAEEPGPRPRRSCVERGIEFSVCGW